jgi:molybdenum cofactor biosynthesis protein B
VSVAEHRAAAPAQLRFAVVTASDSRELATDRGGDLVVAMVGEAGHRLVVRRLVRDEVGELRDAVRDLARGGEVDVVVVTGGTGLAPRDVTPEAVEPLYRRRIDGFGELFRQLSFAEVGAAAMLSRASAGVVGSALVFLLPGSPNAVRLAMAQLILPEAGHLLAHVRPVRRAARAAGVARGAAATEGGTAEGVTGAGAAGAGAVGAVGAAAEGATAAGASAKEGP